VAQARMAAAAPMGTASAMAAVVAAVVAVAPS
jgi:hypothetical protein